MDNSISQVNEVPMEDDASRFVPGGPFFLLSLFTKREREERDGEVLVILRRLFGPKLIEEEKDFGPEHRSG